jgi:hypothetical protein
MAEDALRHWLEPDSDPTWLLDGRIAPLGCRSFIEHAAEERVESEVDPAAREGLAEGELATVATAAESLPEPARLAFLQYRQAVSELAEAEQASESEVTDQRAHRHLTEADVKLPAFDTWARHLRTARRALGGQKKKRRGLYAGRSAVPPEHFGDRRGG